MNNRFSISITATCPPHAATVHGAAAFCCGMPENISFTRKLAPSPQVRSAASTFLNFGVPPDTPGVFGSCAVLVDAAPSAARLPASSLSNLKIDLEEEEEDDNDEGENAWQRRYNPPHTTPTTTRLGQQKRAGKAENIRERQPIVWSQARSGRAEEGEEGEEGKGEGEGVNDAKKRTNDCLVIGEFAPLPVGPIPTTLRRVPAIRRSNSCSCGGRRRNRR